MGSFSIYVYERLIGRGQRSGAEEYLRRPVEGVGVEDGLDHDERLSQILPHELVPVVGALIGTVVEHLQEGGPSQVEHELQGFSTTRVRAEACSDHGTACIIQAFIRITLTNRLTLKSKTGYPQNCSPVFPKVCIR